MKTSVCTEQNINDLQQDLPLGWTMIYFKMVGIGEKTQALAEHKGSALCGVARQQPGFFLISEDGSGLRDAMHDLVNRFCDIQEGKNEPKN